MRQHRTFNAYPLPWCALRGLCFCLDICRLLRYDVFNELAFKAHCRRLRPSYGKGVFAFFFFFFDLDTVDRCESDWRISERIENMHEDLSRFRMPTNDAIRKDIYRSAACGSVPSKNTAYSFAD